MRIGLTYDLRDEYLKEGFTEDETLEFDRVETIYAIEKALKNLGYETYRIGHLKNLIKALLNGERWDIVFNIAEGLKGLARESQIPTILDVYNIPYTFSDPLRLAICLNKDIAKRIIRDAGLKTNDFFIIEKESDIDNFNLKFPVFIKPIAEGTSKGITSLSKIDNFNDLVKNSLSLLKTYKQPVIVEDFLPGREFTVGIIGTKDEAEVIGVLEIFLKSEEEKEVYSYKNKENSEELVEYSLATDKLAQEVGKLALSCWKILGCRDAGRVDIRCDRDNIPNFIELNPLAGLHPTHSDLPILCGKVGIEYQKLIEKIMSSAIKRIFNS